MNKTEQWKEGRNHGILARVCEDQISAAKRGTKWGPEITKRAGRTHRASFLKKAEQKAKSLASGNGTKRSAPRFPEEQWADPNPKSMAAVFAGKTEEKGQRRLNTAIATKRYCFGRD